MYFLLCLATELPIGYLLVEVKLTESKFGSCRGAMKSTLKRPGNPNHHRCDNLAKVVQDPAQQCWMAGEDNGRSYWDFMKRTATPFIFPTEGACPFRYSLYQLMRNQVLAMALRKNTRAEWAELAVCVHPGNDLVYRLKDRVAGEAHALRAFNALLPVQTGKIRELDPLQIVQTVNSIDSNLSEWSDWTIGRYDLLAHH
ncbi:MAG: PGN_0703 family putative restriction endonuclease [Nitrospiraceae bacterium]